MKPKIQIDLTPITEDHLQKLGFQRIDDENGEPGVYAWMLKLPKDNTDPNCMYLISSYNVESMDIGLNEGEYIVELFDSGGLGLCTFVEELDMLYFVLTKENLKQLKKIFGFSWKIGKIFVYLGYLILVQTRQQKKNNKK